MKKAALSLAVLLVFTGLFLAASARSVAVCRQSLYPSLFGDYQHCPTDQTSFFNPPPPPPPTDCILNPNPVELTVDVEDSVSVECPGGCSGTQWNIFKEGDPDPYDGPAVKITDSNQSEAALISTEEFSINDGFTLEVTAMSNGQEISCSAGIESTAGGGIDDYYELGLKTNKEVYRLGEDSDINAQFLVKVIGGGNGSVELKHFLKNDKGEVISQGAQIVQYTDGSGNYEWIIPINMPFGIYQIGGELPVKEDERHTSNNRAQKFVTILEQNREVNIPETTPLLVVLLGLIVILVVKKSKKQLN